MNRKNSTAESVSGYPEKTEGPALIPDSEIEITEVRQKPANQPPSAPSARENEPWTLYSRKALQIYFEEIGKIPVLNRDQERELGQALIRERQRKTQFDGDPDSAEFRDVEEKVRALEGKLVTHNLKLVVKIARRYEGRGLQLMDLIQEGNMGMSHAAEKFLPELGYKFPTYAGYWIRQAIRLAIKEKSRTIKLPAHVNELLNKYLKTVSMLRRKNNRGPDWRPEPEEVAEVMGISFKNVKKIQSLPSAVLSLDNQVYEEQGLRFVDIIPDEGMPPLDRNMVSENTRRFVETLFETLNTNELLVVKQRFGFSVSPEEEEPDVKTLQEVGDSLKLTRERIRQIQEEALKKMRHAARGIETP